jgi:hypothetical protein
MYGVALFPRPLSRAASERPARVPLILRQSIRRLLCLVMLVGALGVVASACAGNRDELLARGRELTGGLSGWTTGLVMAQQPGDCWPNRLLPAVSGAGDEQAHMNELWEIGPGCDDW